MDKLVEFGRRTWFLVKVLSGYEERRIRTYRLQLQRQLEQAQAKKAAIAKLPEKIILSEVRQMVEQMQALNRQLEETEAAIEEHFKPIDKGAELLMSMQLEKEEKHAKEMVKVMRENVMLQREMAQKKFAASEKESVLPNQEQSN